MNVISAKKYSDCIDKLDFMSGREMGQMPLKSKKGIDR